MKSIPYALLWLCLLLMSSCYTGHTYHHPRTSIEPGVQIKEIPSASVPIVKNTPTVIKEDLAVKDSIKPVWQHVSMQTRHVAERRKIRPSHPMSTPKLKKHHQLRKVSDTKSKIDEMADAFISFYFLLIGLPSILLLIAGFIMGCFGIMVGFWICWVLGTIGVTFSAVIFILGWIMAESGARPLRIASALVYLAFVLAAIAFILIVLL